MTKLNTMEDLRIGEELCYRLDSDVYLPVKEELSGTPVPYSLGMRKENFKSTIVSELQKPRQEAIKWIKEMRTYPFSPEFWEIMDELEIRSDTDRIVLWLKHFFDINEEDLK